jgi:hypothetical protein
MGLRGIPSLLPEVLTMPFTPNLAATEPRPYPGLGIANSASTTA